MILSSKGRSPGVLSILQDSLFPAGVDTPRSLFHFGDSWDCIEDELEDLWFYLDIRQLFYELNITFRTLYSSQAYKDYGAEKTSPSAILLVLVPSSWLIQQKFLLWGIEWICAFIVMMWFLFFCQISGKKGDYWRDNNTWSLELPGRQRQRHQQKHQPYPMISTKDLIPTICQI